MTQRGPEIPVRTVRRLILSKQWLAGPRPPPSTPAAIRAVIRELGYVQWDPVPIVAPSHHLALWSRLRGYRPEQLERLLWEERSVFEHWLPMASLVLTEDYPMFRSFMRRYPDSLSDSWGVQREHASVFLRRNASLRNRMLRELREGPRTTGAFADHARTRRHDGEWTSSSDVALMLFHLSMQGEVMVVGREGNQNLWGLSRRFLPPGTDRTALPVAEAERQAALRSIRALGVATSREITTYFLRGRFLDLPAALDSLERDGSIQRARLEGIPGRAERYIAAEDLAQLSAIDRRFRPRVALLPPFDTLVYNQARLRALFGFDYVREQFLPKAKRRFGTYVLPILWGDRLVGRIDPRYDRERHGLDIQAVHHERDAPDDPVLGEALADEIARLATLLGADRVTYSGPVSPLWKRSLN